RRRRQGQGQAPAAAGRRRRAGPGRDRAEPALHRAAAALHRGRAGEDAGGIRHRPAVDLCLDHLHPAKARIRGHGRPGVHPVARGEEQWQPLLAEFWKNLSQQIEDKQQLTREEVAQARELGTDPKSGKPVIVRIGRYGPFVQIGTKDDEEKPRFAGLRKNQDMDKITLDEALYLFNLPRALGEDEHGEPMRANIGPFGPYVQLGEKSKDNKPLYVNLKEDDPYTITLARAKELIAEKKEAEAKKLI